MLRSNNALVDTYIALEALVLDAISEVDDRDKYHVCMYPFGVQKKDGSSIPADVLSKVQNLWTK